MYWSVLVTPSLRGGQGIGQGYHCIKRDFCDGYSCMGRYWLGVFVHQKVSVMRDAQQKPGQRLRIAYTSGSGFHNGTTTARCLQSMFGFHDKKRVKIIGYAMTATDGSEER